MRRVEEGQLLSKCGGQRRRWSQENEMEAGGVVSQADVLMSRARGGSAELREFKAQGRLSRSEISGDVVFRVLYHVRWTP